MNDEPTDRRTRRRVVATAGAGAAGLAALAGCVSPGGEATGTPTPLPPEATVTVRLRNRDPVEREYRVVVRAGDGVTNEFSGVLPADAEQSVEMTATIRATADQHEVAVVTPGGRRGRTWDPTECGEFLVDAFVEGGEPGFTAECRAGETDP